MKRIIIPKINDIPVCAKVYVNAYKTEPWILVMCGSIFVMFLIILWRKKRKKEEN